MNRLKAKRWKKIFNANGVWVGYTSNRHNRLEIKNFTRDKIKHFILIKVSI